MLLRAERHDSANNHAEHSDVSALIANEWNKWQIGNKTKSEAGICHDVDSSPCLNDRRTIGVRVRSVPATRICLRLVGTSDSAQHMGKRDHSALTSIHSDAS